MTDVEKEQIASLHGYPPFEALLSVFREFEDSVLEEQRTAKSNEDVLRTARMWAWTSTIRRVLSEYPANLAEELDRMRQAQPLFDAPPRHLLHLLRNLHAAQGVLDDGHGM